VTNLVQLQNHEEAINYQMRLINTMNEKNDDEVLEENLEEKINIYQQIANSFLQLNDLYQAI
jgi:hypothetical protein